MLIPPIRAKQSTTTIGTGTLTLAGAAADMRGFGAAFGGGTQRVRYILQRAGVYEVGYGSFTFATQALTRDVVVASSNAGALVNLAPGTTDVFFDFFPGDRAIRSVTGTATLALEDLGNFIRCAPTADMTLSLPAIATVPPGMGYLIRNEASGVVTVLIDPNGSELLDGVANAFPLFPGEAIEVFSIGTAWRSAVRPTGWRQVGRISAASSAQVDFALPHYIGAARCLYRVEFRQVRPATDGARLLLRMSADGTTFDAGASDYQNSRGFVSGAAAFSGAAGAANAIQISSDIDSTAAGNTADGIVTVNPGAAGARFGTARGESYTGGNGATFAGPQVMMFAGHRVTAYDVLAIRFLMDSGNINLGDFTLFAMFD